MKKAFLGLIVVALLLFVLPLNSGAEQEAPQSEPLADYGSSVKPQGLDLGREKTLKEPAEEDVISLDIKGMDIVDVLKTLAMRSGLNIVVGKNVVGKVTIFLKDVSPRQALDIILLANGLAYEEKEGIINVMTDRDFQARFGEEFSDTRDLAALKLKWAKATAMLPVLNQVKSKIGTVVADEASNTLVIMDVSERLVKMREMIDQIDRPTETKLFHLKFSQSGSLRKSIDEMLTKGIGTIREDERTNKLIVTDYPEVIKSINQLVGEFDSQTKQVLIESKIVEITLDDKLQLGVDWDYWIKKNLRLDSAFTLNLTTGATATIGSTVANVGDYKVLVDLLKTIGDTKVLSSPRVSALNNQEAKILVGTKEAYITQTTSQSGVGTTVTSESVNFVDVGVQLYVTPTINPDNMVIMKIRPVVSSAVRTAIKSAGTISEIPIVSTSEAETSVMVGDGSTIIIAGLIKDESIKAESKIPILGDIPLLGALFRSTSDQIKKKELVIFLTPHILSSGLEETKESSLDFKESIKMLDKYKQPEAGAIRRLPSQDDKREGALLESMGYLDYLSRIRSLIARTSTLKAGKQCPAGEVEIAFVLSSDGKLASAPKIISSTDDYLEKITVEAVQESVPFPAFPQELDKPMESFEVVVSFSPQDDPQDQ